MPEHEGLASILLVVAPLSSIINARSIPQISLLAFGAILVREFMARLWTTSPCTRSIAVRQS